MEAEKRKQSLESQMALEKELKGKAEATLKSRDQLAVERHKKVQEEKLRREKEKKEKEKEAEEKKKEMEMVNYLDLESY